VRKNPKTEEEPKIMTELKENGASMFGGIFGGTKRSIGKMGEKLPETREGLPDSALPHGLCPRCQKQSSFDVVSTQAVTFDPDVDRGGAGGPTAVDRVSVLHCRNCKQGIVVIEEKCVADRSWREPKAGRSGGGSITWRGIHWWPAADAQVSTDVPVQIAEVFQEAVRAAHAECPRAAAVMARRTLEAIAAEKGETTGVLADRLKKLAANGVLQPTLAEWAKEVRLVGNASAHFDPIESVSKKDAEQLNAFVRELLRYLYELPAELARRKGP
jgi:hypothetical protein